MSQPMFSAFHAPKVSPLNKLILIVLTGFFIIKTIVDLSVTNGTFDGFFALTLAPFLAQGVGQIYRVLTYPLAVSGIMELIFNGLLFWFVGSSLERLLHQKIYSFFLLGALLISAFVGLIVMTVTGHGFMLAGTTPFASSLLVAMAMFFPDEYFAFMLLFPVKAKYMVWFIIAMEIFMAITATGSYGIVLVHLVSMAHAWLFVTLYRRGGLRFMGGFGSGDGGRRSQIRKRPSHLKLMIENADDTDEAKKADAFGRTDEPRFWQ